MSAVKVAKDIWTVLNATPDTMDKAAAQLAGNFIGDLTHSTTILGMLVDLAEQLIASFLEILGGARKDSLDGATKIGEAVLSEFLGVDIKLPPFQGGKGGQATIQAAAAMGKALYTQLNAEFHVPEANPIGPGEAGAQMFSGVAMNFAAQNAVIGLLADALSLHELNQLRDVGEDVARSLGLGRLQRMALGTLLDNAIRKPYTRELAVRLRPDRLSVPEYIHARNRGDITDDQLTTALQETGYRDQDIKAVINEYTDKLSVSELLTLVRFAKMSEDDAVKILQSQGLDAYTADMRFQAAQLAITNGSVTSYVDALNAAMRARTMDPDTWSAKMAQVPWTPDEIQWHKLANGTYLEFYEKMLTWAQVVTAYEQGIVDVDYVEKWLTDKGYSPEDLLNMELLLAVKYDAFATAAAKKGKTAAPAPAPKPAT